MSITDELIKRAFALAQTGNYKNLTAIYKKMHHEGYSKDSMDMHFSGRALRTQVKSICRMAASSPESRQDKTGA